MATLPLQPMAIYPTAVERCSPTKHQTCKSRGLAPLREATLTAEGSVERFAQLLPCEPLASKWVLAGTTALHLMVRPTFSGSFRLQAREGCCLKLWIEREIAIEPLEAVGPCLLGFANRSTFKSQPSACRLQAPSCQAPPFVVPLNGSMFGASESTAPSLHPLASLGSQQSHGVSCPR